MKRIKLFILGLSILLSLSLVLTGCGNSGDNVGIGEIVGQITYDNGDVQGTNVVLLNENPEDISFYEELSIVQETTVDNNEGTYFFDGLFSGTYFVAAYMDENGSGELEFDEASESPLEPANVYGVDGVPESVEVEDSTVTGINIDISYEVGDYPQYNVDVVVTDPVGEENYLENATVFLRGKSGEQIKMDTTNARGQSSFDNIFDGEYYLEVISENDTHRGAILPYYRFRDIEDGSMNVRFDVPMFTDSFIINLYGSGAEDELFLGILGVNDVGNESVTLDPYVSAEDIAYTRGESGGEIIFDFTSTEFPVDPPATEPGYMLGIKNISSSVDEYTLSITIDGVEETISFPVKADRLITALDQSDEAL